MPRLWKPERAWRLDRHFYHPPTLLLASLAQLKLVEVNNMGASVRLKAWDDMFVLDQNYVTDDSETVEWSPTNGGIGVRGRPSFPGPSGTSVTLKDGKVTYCCSYPIVEPARREPGPESYRFTQAEELVVRFVTDLNLPEINLLANFAYYLPSASSELDAFIAVLRLFMRHDRLFRLNDLAAPSLVLHNEHKMLATTFTEELSNQVRNTLIGAGWKVEVPEPLTPDFRGLNLPAQLSPRQRLLVLDLARDLAQKLRISQGVVDAWSEPITTIESMPSFQTPADQFTLYAGWKLGTKGYRVGLDMVNHTPWFMQAGKIAPFFQGLLGFFPQELTSLPIGEQLNVHLNLPDGVSRRSTLAGLSDDFERWTEVAAMLRQWGLLLASIRSKLGKLPTQKLEEPDDEIYFEWDSQST